MLRVQGSDRWLAYAAELQNAASGLPAIDLPPGVTLCPDKPGAGYDDSRAALSCVGSMPIDRGRKRGALTRLYFPRFMIPSRWGSAGLSDQARSEDLCYSDAPSIVGKSQWLT